MLRQDAILQETPLHYVVCTIVCGLGVTGKLRGFRLPKSCQTLVGAQNCAQRVPLSVFSDFAHDKKTPTWEHCIGDFNQHKGLRCIIRNRCSVVILTTITKADGSLCSLEHATLQVLRHRRRLVLTQI